MQRRDEPREPHWTDQELRAAVTAYLEMLELDRLGARYSKAEFTRRLRVGPLRHRSVGSIHRRMSNISAVLAAQGIDWIPGYKPLSHVGRNVRPRIEEFLDVSRQGARPQPELHRPTVRKRALPGVVPQPVEIQAPSIRTAEQRELALVLRYAANLRASACEVSIHTYDLGSGLVLACDLFNETAWELIEAKASARRDDIRMAIGQLIDYQRFEAKKPRLAILVPDEPSDDLKHLIRSIGASVVWPRPDGSFIRTGGGSDGSAGRTESVE